jgi:hypothetical protein
MTDTAKDSLEPLGAIFINSVKMYPEDEVQKALKAAMAENEKLVDCLMKTISPHNQRWCESDLCACSGCANGLVTKEQFISWEERMVAKPFVKKFPGDKPFVRQGTTVCSHGTPTDQKCIICFIGSDNG